MDFAFRTYILECGVTVPKSFFQLSLVSHAEQFGKQECHESDTMVRYELTNLIAGSAYPKLQDR